MIDHAREQLLGHLLGALDDAEQQQVDARLKSDPDFRREEVALRRAMEPLLTQRPDFTPPPGLAKRTCEFVAVEVQSKPTPFSRRRPMSPEKAPPSWISNVRWLDVSIAVAVFFAAALLTIPAIQTSRFNSRVTLCQEGFRKVGQGLTQYSEQHDGRFPLLLVQDDMNTSGTFSQVLLRDGLIDQPNSLICPSSPMKDEEGFHVPTFAEIQSAPLEKLGDLWRWSAGTLGMHMGDYSSGMPRGTRNRYRPTFAVLADAPSSSLPGYQSASHGGRGQNVWFEDGHVRFITSPKLPNDNIFLNRQGRVGPGVDHNDAVIVVPSNTPIIFTGNGK